MSCATTVMACEAHLKGPLSMVSLHAAIAHRKPTLREQGVQPQGLLPVPLSLQTKSGCQHMMLQVKDESGVPCLDPTNSSMHDAVGWTQRGEGRAGGGWGGWVDGVAKQPVIVISLVKTCHR